MIPFRKYYHQFPPRQNFPSTNYRRNIPIQRMKIRPSIKYPNGPRQSYVPKFNVKRMDNFVKSAPESSSQRLKEACTLSSSLPFISK